jgi:hypothetical protein
MSEHASSDDDNNSVVNYNKLVWNQTVEKLFVNWCDIARCYKWMHEKAHHKYRKINYAFAIPIIVLSTLTGTANIGVTTLVPPSSLDLANVGIGLVSIFTGIVGTLQSFFRYPQLSEAHLNAYTGWSRLQRLILTELNLERKARRNAGDFLKICRNEYERLMEQSPLIPPDVTKEFIEKFGNIKDLLVPDTLENVKATAIFTESDEEDFEEMISNNDKIKALFEKKLEERLVSIEMLTEAKKQLHKKILDIPIHSHSHSHSHTNSNTGLARQVAPHTPNSSHRRPSVIDDRVIPFTERIPKVDSDIKINVKELISKMEDNDAIKKKYVKPETPIFSVVENKV